MSQESPRAKLFSDTIRFTVAALQRKLEPKEDNAISTDFGKWTEKPIKIDKYENDHIMGGQNL